MEVVDKKTSNKNIHDIEEEYLRLQENFQQVEADLEKARNKQRDTNLKLADLSTQQAVLRSRYEEQFSRHIQDRSGFKNHPLVRESLRESKCHLCGAQSTKTKLAIEDCLSKGICPLCGTKPSAKSRDPKDLQKLKDIDRDLSRISRAETLYHDEDD